MHQAFLAPRQTWALCSIALLAGIAMGLSACDEPAQAPVESNLSHATPALVAGDLGEAADFSLPTLEGDTLQLSQLRGRVVALNFWATWCIPCLAEMPELVELHDALHPHGLRVVGVSLDTEEPAVVRQYVERFGITYPIVLGDRQVAQAYGGVWALPMTFLIDADGAITRRIVGRMPMHETLPEILAMLGGK